MDLAIKLKFAGTSVFTRLFRQLFFQLFKTAHFQEVNLFLCEVTPTAAGQIIFRKAGEIYTVEFCDMVAERFEYAADNAVAAGVYFDAGLVAVGFRGIRYCVGMYFAVFKLDAVGDALHIFFGYVAVGPDVVYFFLGVLRMGKFRGQVTIVGEQQHAGGIAVEASYGIYSLVACAFHEIHHGHATVGVVGCGDAIFGLVEQNVCLAFESYYLFIVFHNVGMRYLCAEFGHNFAVDFYKALLNEFVCFAARAYSGICHELVETDFFIGIRNRHFVFNRTGTRHKALAFAGESSALLASLIIAALTLLIAAVLALTLLVAALALLIAAVLALTLLVAALALLVTALTLLIAAFLVFAIVMLLIAALTLLVSALALLVAALALLISALALLVAALALLISALTLLIAALTLLVAALALLIASLALLVAALTLLIAALTLLVTALVSVFRLCSGIAGIVCQSGILLVGILVIMLALLVAALTLLIATLTLLISALAVV